MDKDEIAILGNSLRQIDQRLTSAKRDGTQRIWFQGGEPYFDMFIELRERSIEWFQFTLRGQSLSWHQQKPGWQTGKTNEMRVDDVNFYPASKLIQPDNTPDSAFIELVHSILKTRGGEDIFDQILVLFES